ncbi:HAAS signaling domain-containing protein [Actinoplanes awajinensis]|uniref:Uncharacterized protein n=1 Tax=Actinoplanes awajinensis subsp. mycoplanecinus TaxID=135947 RepID=A0A124G7U6_9ACTN|nr:hypothetical protein [Actinoplanes awajinensis]KUL23697.1 hypothetical protein ADL15_45305 [Actinoplanes awajinensis subsp. mycoplanecinus]
MNDVVADEITGYVAQVRLALGGLPEKTREELLEDLPEHLAEVRAEGTGTLVERLGEPAAYAAELLAAAEVPDVKAEKPDRYAELKAVRDQVVRGLREADVRVGPVLGYAKASEFLALLRPAWWVLRGYLAAMVLVYLFDSIDARIGLLPRIGGSVLLGLVLLGACVVGSIWLGRRGTPTGYWPRYAYWSGTALLVLIAMIGFVTVDGRSQETPSYLDATYSGNSGYENVRDVFVYDGQGHPVENAQLYDQNGQPIQLGSQWCDDPDTGESVQSWQRGYPRCPKLNPFVAPSPTPMENDEWPTPDPPAPSSVPPSLTPSVTPSVTPSAKPIPSSSK